MRRFRDAAVGFCEGEEQSAATIDTIFDYLTLKSLFILDSNLAANAQDRREKLLLCKELLDRDTK